MKKVVCVGCARDMLQVIEAASVVVSWARPVIVSGSFMFDRLWRNLIIGGTVFSSWDRVGLESCFRSER